MIPVMQTKRGGTEVAPEDRGDCWAACLASILEVPIEAVTVPHDDSPTAPHWWDATQELLRPLGWEVMGGDRAVWPPSGYWIAQVPSKNLVRADGSREKHVVVMRGGEVAHDPCLGERWEVGTDMSELDVTGWYVLLPLPADAAAGEAGPDARCQGCGVAPGQQHWDNCRMSNVEGFGQPIYRPSAGVAGDELRAKRIAYGNEWYTPLDHAEAVLARVVRERDEAYAAGYERSKATGEANAAADDAEVVRQGEALARWVNWLAEDYFEGQCDCHEPERCIMHQARAALASYRASGSSEETR